LCAEVVGGLPGKFLDDALELRKFLAPEALLEDGRECAAFFGKERQITLRPANVPCKDHQFPLPAANFSLRQVLQLRVAPMSAVTFEQKIGFFGPQLPDGYCGTLAVLVALQTSRIGSTSDQAASTLSPRSKSVASPRTQSFRRVA